MWSEVAWGPAVVSWGRRVVTWRAPKVTWRATEVTWGATEVTWRAPKVTWRAPKVTWGTTEVTWRAPKVTWGATEVTWGATEVTWGATVVSWGRREVPSIPRLGTAAPPILPPRAPPVLVWWAVPARIVKMAVHGARVATALTERDGQELRAPARVPRPRSAAAVARVVTVRAGFEPREPGVDGDRLAPLALAVGEEGTRQNDGEDGTVDGLATDGRRPP